MRFFLLLRAVPILALFLPAAERQAHAQSASDLLPDLVVDPAALSHTRIDTRTLPGRRLMRLSTSTPNIGAGALEIRGSAVVAPDQQQVLQRIYRSDGSFSDRLAGTFVYHPTHQHTHFGDWAVYRLRSVLEDGNAGAVIASGNKTSFCLLDVVPYDPGGDIPVVPPAAYTTCGATIQGISPGWADVYDLELDDQWIDVTGLPDGAYWLEAEVDPANQILELPPDGEDNNVSRIRIVLTQDEALPDQGPDPAPGDPDLLGGGGEAPQVQWLAPVAPVTWVEHSYAGLPVQWSASDPEGDAVSVTLYADREPTHEPGALPIGGYENLRGNLGQAVINTAALELGTWYLYAEVSDGASSSGAPAPGSVVLYAKGDLDFDGHVDRQDWVMLVERRRELADQPLSAVVSGWEQLLDEDRDGDVDDHDIDLFRSAALSPATDPGH
jgi:hypothetical protein